jgi:glycolate oxidase FAD binding subunit
MTDYTPTTANELAGAMREAASRGKPLLLGGRFTKDRMGGTVAGAESRISTSAMKRVLAYEPKDLTVSVEAGLPYAELTAMLAREKQMIALDPPLAGVSTVGGVIASNLCGSRRRLYGTARDVVIGMTYCTTEGEVAETGALVVKSVAGYDIHKLLTGSYGTLAAISSVNFKVSPEPELLRTFVLHYASAAEAAAYRKRIAESVLQPASADYLNPAAARACGLDGHLLLVRAGGTERLLARYERELPGAEVLEGGAEAALWRTIEELAPNWMDESGGLAVVKVVHTAPAMPVLADMVASPVWSHALNGITRVACASAEEVKKVCAGHVALVEWSDPARREGIDLWPEPGGDLEIMRQMKSVFDPKGLLNPGRLHGRI